MSSSHTLPRVDCSECGRRCRTISGVCGPCRGIGVDSDVLDGGRWVPVGGILRWVADLEEAS